MEEELQESRLEALHEEMAETEVQYTSPHQRTKTPLLNINTKKVLKQSIMNPDDKGGLEFALQLKDQYGAHGEDLQLIVPVGTVIKDAET